MNVVSSVIRMLCGLAVLVLTWSSWSKYKAALSGDGPVTVYGQPAGMMIGVFALIGLGLFLLGLVGLLKGKK